MSASLGGLARTVGQLAVLLPRAAHPRSVVLAFAAAAALAPVAAHAQTSDQVRIESTTARDAAIGGVAGNVLSYVLGGNRTAATVLGAVAGGLVSRSLGVSREESREAALMSLQFDGPPMQRRSHEALRGGFIRAAAARLDAQSRHEVMQAAEIEMEIARVNGDPALLAREVEAFRAARGAQNVAVLRLNAQLAPLKSLLETAQRQGYDVKAGWDVFDNRLGGNIAVVSTFDHWPADAQQEVSRIRLASPSVAYRAGAGYEALAACGPRHAVGERCVSAPRE